MRATVTSDTHGAGVLVIAHRGSPADGRPENTVAAVHAAFDAGADGVEVDVRLTADGVLALSHDPDLTRLTGHRADVATRSWEELSALAGRHGLPLARVHDVLEAAAGRRVILEAKPPPPALGTAGTASALARELLSLRRQGLPLQVTVSSFSATLVAHVRHLLPQRSGFRTALLGTPLQHPSRLVREAIARGHDEVHPHMLAVLPRPGAITAARACGLATVAWTVNDHLRARRLSRHGVTGVITDVPASLRTTLPSAAVVPGNRSPAHRPAPA